MTTIRLCATALVLAIAGPPAIAADPQPVRPIPFESGTAVSFQPLEAIRAGTGPATAVATSGTWLAVGTDRLTAGLPADDHRVAVDIFSGVDSVGRWRSSAGVDLYALRDDGGLAFAAHVATRNGVRALAVNDKGRLVVADQQYVTCFQVGPKGLVRQWQHYFPRARQVEFGSRGGQPLPLVIAASDQRIDVLADTSGGSVEQRLSFTCSCRRFYQGVDTLLVAGMGGEAAVYQITDVADREHLVRTLPLLGSIAGLAPHGAKTALALSRDYGLRLLSPTAYMSRAGVPAADLDLAAWQGKGVWQKARDGLVVAERPLADATGYAAVHAAGPDRAILLRADGRAETVAIDEAARTLAAPRPIATRAAAGATAAPGFVAAATGSRLAVLLDREGRVWRLDGDAAVPAIETAETGPWVSAGERLFVAVGPALKPVTETGLGPAAVTVAGRRIIDAAVDGGPSGAVTAFVLAEKSLDVVALDGEPRKIASVPLAAAGRRVFAGAGLACVVQGARDVATFDVSDPSRPRLLATRTLELPLNWCVPLKFADPDRFLFQVDDMLLESDRAVVAGGELFLFDPAELRRGSGPLAPARVVHRPMGSFDDTELAKRVARVAPDTYHWNSDHIEISRRAYLTRLEPGLGQEAGQPETRHCRAGTGLARHTVVRDGIAYVAASRMGLRAIRFDGLDAELVGAVTEPDCRFEAVHFAGDVVHVKDGDTIRRYRVAAGPSRPGTAFEFAPLADGGIPRLLDRGQDVTTREYAAGRSLFQRLTVARTDLGDESGWPRTAVPHGTVAVDPVRGRVKFSDGRPAASRFLDEVCCYMWPPSGNWWMPVGDYVCAPSGEIGHGFLVFDARNPDRPRVVGAAGHSPWGAYSNRSIGVRGTTAYIGDNWFRMLIALDVADPTKPRYIRSIDLPDADLPGLDDPQYRGVFRGDRLLMPTYRGLHEIDVADPAAMRLVAVHAKVPALRWIDDAGRRGIEFERQKGQLVLWNLDDLSAPREIARLVAGEATGLASFQGFLVEGDRLYLWGGRDANSSGLTTWAFSPDAPPRLLGLASLGGPLTEARVHDGHVLVGRMGPAFEVWRIEGPTAARKLGQVVGQDFARDYWQHFGGVKPNLLDCRDLVMNGAVRVVHLDGRIAWVKCGDVESACDLGLVAVDWTDPERPRLREGILGPNEETTDVLVDPERRIAQSCAASYLVDLADPERLDVLWGYNNNLAHGAERAAGAAGEIVTRQPRGGFLRLDLDRRDRPHATQTGFTPGLFMADPDTRLGGRPAMLAAAKFTRVESDPFPVDPAREVAVAAVVRVLSRANVPAAFRLSLVSTATGKIVAGLEATAAAGGSIQQLARTFKLPSDCREVRVRIEQIDGQVWFAGLEVTQDAANLLTNPDFTAPPTEPGRWPGWTVAISRGTFGQGHHDAATDTLYFPSGPNLLVFDMKNPRPEPVGFTGAEVRPGADEGKAVTVVERGGRRLAVVGTNLGLVTVDVTDPRRPIRLGATNLPWGKMFPMRVGVSGNTAVVAPGYTSFWWTTGLYTVDISDPARPRHVGTIIDNTTGFCIDGPRVYVNSYLNGAAIYDITRPENPLLVEETIFDDTNAGAGGTGLVGDVLVRSMGGGMETWRATMPPQAPTGPLTIAAP